MGTKRSQTHESMLPLLAYIQEKGINEAEFAAKVLEISHGRFTNWKRRGVPQGMQAKVAAKIGKSTDDYLIEIGRPAGAAQKGTTLSPDETIMLERYRKASPRWRAALRELATLHADVQDDVAESVSVLYAKISANHARDKRVVESYGLPPDAGARSGK